MRLRPGTPSRLPTPPSATVALDAAAIDVTEPFGYAFAKRAFDLVVGCAILLLLVPVIPMVGLMIRMDSQGPVFYRQERVGKKGRPFKFYKFRSMRVDSDRLRAQLESSNEMTGPVFKMKNDPRVTAVGQFLRRSSLDEIPQIFNVLKGDMSIVGPRPALPGEVAKYEAWHRRRLDVKPGITCLWQVAGRSHVGFDEWMRLDIEYMSRRSLRTDLGIFVKTIPAVIARRGAY
ncbi:MAG TPA: sugar transferase [Candidatus Krumholzibacteria bacterium]|nr:sugar transferase [Candidatus Krumholzibacteria bacterium]